MEFSISSNTSSTTTNEFKSFPTRRRNNLRPGRMKMLNLLSSMAYLAGCLVVVVLANPNVVDTVPPLVAPTTLAITPTTTTTTTATSTQSPETEVPINTSWKPQDHHQQQQQQQNGDNISTNQTVASEAGTPPATMSVFRSSMEERASELSKKHLNLEHENWRLKQSASTQQQQQQQASSSAPLAAATAAANANASPELRSQAHHQQVAAAPTTQRTILKPTTTSVYSQASAGEGADGAEQDIRMPAATKPQGELPTVTVTAAGGITGADGSSRQEGFLSGKLNERHRDHYLHLDSATAAAASVGRQASSASRQNGQQQHQHRRKKVNHQFQQQQQNYYYEDNELQQCHQYLQRHGGSPYAAGGLLSSSFPSSQPKTVANLLGSSSARFASSNHHHQQLPCSCEPRSHSFDAQLIAATGDSAVWLSCDNVQLMGSHFYTLPTNADDTSASQQQQQHNDTLNGATNDNNSYGGDHELVLTRFSQRDAGLLTLHSQKFHYLQLFHLKSIDLSDNRIRQIKMDAFHGLETKLEHLNLANNLLGDSRAMFDDAAQNSNAPHGTTTTSGSSANSNSNNNNNRRYQGLNGRLIFVSDELNRLRKLKWLSLHNNQINQLGSSIFIKPPPPPSSSSPANAAAAAASAGHYASSVDSTSTTTLSELSYLDLSENLLKFIPSDSIYLLSKLQTLNLSRNRITRLDQLSKFPRALKYLDLSENLIRTVHHCDLIDLPDLIELNLSHNQLSHLDKTAFISSVSSNLLLPASSLSSSSASSLSAASQQHHQADHYSRLLTADRSPDEKSALSPGDATLRLGVDASAVSGGDDQASFDHDDGGVERDEQSGKLLGRQTRNRRDAKATASGGAVAADSFDETVDDNGGADDLEADESIISSITSQLTGRQQQAIGTSGELQQAPAQNQFNATRRLNLSSNFFEQIPGDSLLKFSNLHQLDLSFNRIRRIDSNYLCSIYNLVENLHHLDLSGNLFSISYQNTTTQAGDSTRRVKQLNKLFGCLQKLESLTLATNRLGSRPASVVSGESQSSSSPTSSDEYDDDLRAPEEVVSGEAGDEVHDERLYIKFGESSGSRYLSTLDLSDNQLKLMPIVEQIYHPPIVLMTNATNSSIASHQAQLNQWMNSRIYLEVLNLSFNYLERLEEHEFEHLFNLRQLYLDSNKLSSLPIKLMRRFTSLDRLSLSGNRISSLDPLNELIERSAKTLRFLNLANNRLAEWPKITLESLASLYNHHQEFRPSPASPDGSERQSVGLVFALEELNLEGNLLTSNNVSSLFDQLTHMKSLKTLNLSYNLLNRIKSEWFKFANKSLQKLLLTGNKINTIDLGSFAADQANELILLRLDFNLLKELKRKTFDSLPKIRELNLANNLIHTINSETFHQVNSLQILKLNNNRLTSWKCEYFSNLCNSISGNINADLTTLLSSNLRTSDDNNPLPSSVSSLIELDLSHNSLSQLRANSISVHTKLTRLNLEHNKLSFIPHDLFKVTTSGSTTGRQIQLVSSLKYLNLAHNRIQTIDNINFRPLKNLISLDLSFNELQTLGVDVVLMDSRNIQEERNHRRVLVSNNLTNLLVDDEVVLTSQSSNRTNNSKQQPIGGGIGSQTLHSASTSWPALSKLRHLNLANNQLTMVNQSLLNELSPFVLLNLNLSSNLLDSEALPYCFYTKITGAAKGSPQQQHSHNNQQHQQQSSQEQAAKQQANYDLVFTLKLESLDLSYNRLNEFPTNLLDNHYTSMESCNLSHNRIQNLAANSNLMIQIKSLNLEFNPLSRESNELILFEQKSVRHLNLAATRLYAIQQATSATADHLSSGFSTSQLKFRLVNQTSQLDLIRSISRPIDAPYLRHLNLSSNQLVWLAANVFEKMHSLQTLDLSNNQLTRLHLLNNQLAHVSSTLEYLNMGSNLFTNLDSNDFSQLSKIQYLDLSNLLSLQKMNCKFLAKLTTLKTLKMFNYPQLRHSMNNLLNTLNSYQNHEYAHSTDGSGGGSEPSTERLQRKLRNELIMSTIGRHCFQEESSSINTFIADESVYSQMAEVKWFDLQELELELFNSFDAKQQELIGGGFKLKDELSQLIGPHTKKLTLFGLNLTSLSDDSLLGIASDELKLKISYTSFSQLPLKQILAGVAKRTKLDLDFRNNNIQSIDVRGLQLLDELQLNSQMLQHNGQSSSLKLGSNPFRCDCQTRPLWLWLNQRWGNADAHLAGGASGGEEQAATGDTPPMLTTITTNNGANHHWLKLNSITQTSDLRCHYPLKLRGKLAQHVYYNDLVCKGGSSSSLSAAATIATNRQSRKRNDTSGTSGRSSDSYYLTASGHIDPTGDGGDEFDEEDFVEIDPKSAAADAGLMAVVRVTKFNRYPTNAAINISLHYLNSIPVPFIRDRNEIADRDPIEYDSNRIGKRDHNSAVNLPRAHSVPAAADGMDVDAVDSGNGQPVNTRYNKHRPNTHQRHSSFNTLNAFNPLSTLGKNLPARASHASSTKYSLLTDSDVIILTVISIAMMIMAFIIIAICLFKYKMDQSDKQRILSTSGKLFVSPAHVSALMNGGGGAKMIHHGRKHGGGGSNLHSGSSNSSSGSSKHSRKTGSDTSSKRNSSKQSTTTASGKTQINRMLVIGNPKGHPKYFAPPAPPNHLHHHAGHHQVLVPMGPILAPNVGQNFLMRSPTIRRMRGLATNASDWFKFTLRAYPSEASNRRRRLFVTNSMPGANQLSAAQLGPPSQFKLDSKLLPAALAAGCPFHAFKSIRKLRDPARKMGAGSPIDEQCLHCARLLAAIQQTKVQYLIGATREEFTSSSDTNSSSVESPKRRTNEGGEQVEAPKSSVEQQNQPNTNQLDIKTQAAADANDQPYYIPPKLIEALAKRLDRRNEERLIPLSREQMKQQRQQQQQQASTSGAGYRWREQQLKSMRTFKFNGPSSCSDTISSTTTKNPQAETELHSRSQLPTIDVDGRFAYQTESQLESPAYGAARFAQGSSRPDTRGENTPSSHVSGDGHEDIFILVHEPSVGASTLKEHLSIVGGGGAVTGDGGDAGRAAGEIEIARVRDDDTGQQASGGSSIMGASSMMNDECSRSSSPDAYGFMRSSLSATTLSSTTMNTAHNHYTVNNSPEGGQGSTFTTTNNRIRTRSVKPFGSFRDDNENGGNNNNNNNSDNNNTEYSASRKEDTMGLVFADDAQNDYKSSLAAAAATIDEQIIISRL